MTTEVTDPCNGAGSPLAYPIGGLRALRMAPAVATEPAFYESTLTALARAIGEWLPELGGRAFAVSEAEVTTENVPTLPLAMVALQKESAEHSGSSNAQPLIKEDILVQYWVRPARYERADGSESPFWSHYDYGNVRDRMLAGAIEWRSPRSSRLKYISMDIEADQLAVVLTFRFEHAFKWCPPTRPSEAQVETGCILSWCISPGPPG